MKRYIKPTSAALAFTAMAMAGFSHAGNIQFNGQVTAQTCKSDIFGVTNPTIYLDSVASSAFTAVGDTAGYTEFTIKVSGCTAPTSAENISVSFQADGLVDAGDIVNTYSGGSNANLRLFNDANGVGAIALNGNLLTTATGMTLEASQTETSRKYYVGYVATDAATTVGPVTGAVNYVIRYQ